jgi:hypothetical protein
LPLQRMPSTKGTISAWCRGPFLKNLTNSSAKHLSPLRVEEEAVNFHSSLSSSSGSCLGEAIC